MLPYCFETDRIDDSEAAGEAIGLGRSWVSNFAEVDIGVLFDVLLQLLALLLRKAVVLLLGDHEMVGQRIHLDLCGRVFGLKDFLGEHLVQLLDLDDSQFLAFDTYDTLEALS